jgi:hypothetical protein
MVIHSLHNDTGPDTITLPKLKNFLTKNAKPEYAEQLRTRFKEVRLTPKEQAAFKKIDALRDKYLAHTLRGPVFDPAERPEDILYAEIDLALNAVNRLHHAILVGVGSVFEMGRLTGRHGQPGEMQRWLDLALLDSPWCRWYDSRRDGWERLFGQMITQEEIDLLNELRSRHGLEPIEWSPREEKLPFK